MKKTDLKISQDVYDWCVKSFDMVQRNFGIKIHLHDEDDVLPDGQIFLFNHFARFETAIPPYIFYKKMGVHTRTIADHRLFKNEKLAEFIRGGGGVPNNQEGLLPFLAAEILKGRKVVIFPEGGMIKDRRVMDAEGQYRIFSHTKNTYRKHHRGAAVLALTLELFKQRIRDLFEQEDTERLDHWCEALDIATHAELKERIDKPTNVIPGTITFNPIRVGDNILSRGVRWFTKGKAETFIEEMIVEGNILLKDTDMDIRLGKPIIARQKWNKMEKWLLDRYFLSVNSLDEFFGLKETAERWSEKLLSYIVQKETDRIRDVYMEEIYKGVTVNIGHIASEIILNYVEDGREEVDKSEFHRSLYLAVKQLQEDETVYLHKSLNEPENFAHLLDGESRELARFMKTATNAGLITVHEKSYALNEKLTHEHAYTMVRKENPILVYANEAKPVKQLQGVIQNALVQAQEEFSQTIARRMFDDELREHAWRKGKYTHPKYDEINKQETATQSGKPYLLTHEHPVTTGILLVHGFSSSPAELKDFGEHLFSAGYNVMGVRLAGHGTSPYDMENFTYADWAHSVETGYEILSGFVDEIIVVGFSTGGTLALNFAQNQHEKLKGIVSVCAPLDIHGSAVPFVPFVNGLNKITKFIPKVDGVKRFAASNSSKPSINYKNFPISAVNELILLMDSVSNILPNVTIPTCVLQATKDTVVKAESAEKIYANLGSAEKEIHWVESENHSIITHNIGNSWEIVRNYIEALGEKPNKTESQDVKAS